MPTLTLTIPIGADWPTSADLAGRDAVEAALGASKTMQCAGAGGGRGEMHLAFRVEDKSQVTPALAKIDIEMALLLPDRPYGVTVEGDPVREVQIKAGDVFLVPLAEGKYAIGLCRFVFENYEGFTACRFFDRMVSEPKLVDPLPQGAAFDPLFVSDAFFVDGTWPIVGRADVNPGPLMYRSGGGIYDGEKYLKPTDYTEDVPNLYLSGPVATEIQLREYFGLSGV